MTNRNVGSPAQGELAQASVGELVSEGFGYAIYIAKIVSALTLRRTTQPPPLSLKRRKDNAVFGHRSLLTLCARSSHFGTHNGCPLCYETPRSSLGRGGLTAFLAPLCKNERGKGHGIRQGPLHKQLIHLYKNARTRA